MCASPCEACGAHTVSFLDDRQTLSAVRYIFVLLFTVSLQYSLCKLLKLIILVGESTGIMPVYLHLQALRYRVTF